MSKHLIKGFVTLNDPGYGKPEIGFSTYKPSAQFSPNTVIVSEHEFYVDVPKNFDARLGLVANLEELKRQAGADFAKKVRDIDQRIQSLLAITNEA